MDETLQQLSSTFLPIGLAFAFAGSFYAGMARLGKRLSPNTNAAIELWLKGDYKDTWAKLFCEVFDQFFGKKHLSIKTFVISSIISIATVFTLYIVLTQIFDVLGTRTPSRVSLFKALLIGAILNIIPDYISLFETRWILKKLSLRRNFFYNVFFLFLDLLLSALIIFFAIYLFQVFSKQSTHAWIELVAFFSIYSIFFYSTFSTSIWSWLFFLSKWFIILFTKLKLDKLLNVASNPLASIGFVSSIFIFFITLAISPQLSSDQHNEITAFDQFLCDKFPSEICEHHARRLTSDEEKVVEWLLKACEAGVSQKCWDVTLINKETSNLDVNRLWEKACYNGYSVACDALAFSYLRGQHGEQDTAEGIAILERNCNQGASQSCGNLAAVHYDGIYVQKNVSKAIKISSNLCNKKVYDYHSCLALANILIRSNSEMQQKEAFTLLNRICESSNYCTLLGKAQVDGRGTDRNIEKGIKILSKSCDSGLSNESLACSYLGNYIQDGRYNSELESPEEQAQLAQTYFYIACSDGHNIGCHHYSLSLLEHSEKEGTQEEEAILAAIGMLTNNCDSDISLSCDAIAKFYRSTKTKFYSINKSKKYHKKACNLKLHRACLAYRLLYEKNDRIDSAWKMQ